MTVKVLTELKLAVPMARQPKEFGLFFKKRSWTLEILPGACNSTASGAKNAVFSVIWRRTN